MKTRKRNKKHGMRTFFKSLFKHDYWWPLLVGESIENNDWSKWPAFSRIGRDTVMENNSPKRVWIENIVMSWEFKGMMVG